MNYLLSDCDIQSFPALYDTHKLGDLAQYAPHCQVVLADLQGYHHSED